MNELHKELIVIFVLSEVLSAIIFTVSLYSGRSAEGMIFLLFGINLAVIGLNNGITILLVRHHVRNYMDQMNKVRMEAEHDRLTGLYNRNGRCSSLTLIISNRSMTGKDIRKETGCSRSLRGA